MNTSTPIHSTFLLLVVGLLLPWVAAAENERVIFETSFEQPEEYEKLGIEEIMVTGEGRNDEAALRLIQRRFPLPIEALTIHPERTYRFEAAFKAAPGTGDTRVIMILSFCDAEGNKLNNFSISPVAGTESVLKTDAVVHAQELLLENSGQNWPAEGTFAVALDVKNDLSDIPNPNVFKIASTQVEGDGLRVTLEDALTGDFPAGTPVRWHQLADPPMIHATATDQWEVHSLTVGGQALPGDSHRQMRGKFWPGVSTVRLNPGFYHRNPEAEQKEVWVDDIRLIEVTE